MNTSRYEPPAPLLQMVREEEDRAGVPTRSRVRVGVLPPDTLATTDYYQSGCTITFDVAKIQHDGEKLIDVVQHEVKHVLEGDGKPSWMDYIPGLRTIRGLFHEYRANRYAKITPP